MKPLLQGKNQSMQLSQILDDEVIVVCWVIVLPTDFEPEF
jgi:hypothetical protein